MEILERANKIKSLDIVDFIINKNYNKKVYNYEIDDSFKAQSAMTVISGWTLFCYLMNRDSGIWWTDTF